MSLRKYDCFWTTQLYQNLMVLCYFFASYYWISKVRRHLFKCEVWVIKLKAAAALLQNMVSTEEEVRYNDLALFYIAKLLYEGIDELEEFSDELKNDKLK